MSATTTYQMALIRLLARTLTRGGSLASISTLKAIQSMKRPPASSTNSTLRTLRRDERQPHAQNHRQGCAADAADAPLTRGQRAHRHSDHERVIAGQQQVDQDQREARDQEVAGGHVVAIHVRVRRR